MGRHDPAGLPATAHANGLERPATRLPPGVRRCGLIDGQSRSYHRRRLISRPTGKRRYASIADGAAFRGRPRHQGRSFHSAFPRLVRPCPRSIASSLVPIVAHFLARGAAEPRIEPVHHQPPWDRPPTRPPAAQGPIRRRRPQRRARPEKPAGHPHAVPASRPAPSRPAAGSARPIHPDPSATGPPTGKRPDPPPSTGPGRSARWRRPPRPGPIRRAEPPAARGEATGLAGVGPARGAEAGCRRRFRRITGRRIASPSGCRGCPGPRAGAWRRR